MVVMMRVTMPVVGVQKIRVNVELCIEVEALQVKHLGDGHLTKVHGLLRCAGVHVFDAVHQRLHLISTDQVGLADEDLIGKTDLATGLLTRVKLGFGVFGVNQGQHRIKQIRTRDLVVHEEGLRHRPGVGKARGFDHHAIKVELAFALFLGQISQR